MDFFDGIDADSVMKNFAQGSGSGGEGSDPGLRLSRSDNARRRWNQMTNAQRQEVRKALEARGKWRGGKTAQATQKRGGY